MADSPFPDLNVSDFGFLNDITTRQMCSYCGKSRMYYCYTCFKPLATLQDKMPDVQLPFYVDIIKHPGEICGKSTSVHAAILSPRHVNIHIYPNIPQYLVNNVVAGKEDENQFGGSTVLLYPCKESFPLKEFVATRFNNMQQKKIDVTHGVLQRVVFIDSTWFQAYKILTDHRLQNIPRIELDAYETKFWRYQLDKPSTYLSTIEAIYYCVKEYSACIKQLSHDSGCESHVNTRLFSKELITTSDVSTKTGLTITKSNEDCVGYVNPESNVKPLINLNEPNYDDLLFFFCFFYCKIRKNASESGRILKSYSQQRKKKQ
ncbi:hypothetical protein HELRODRAFT_108178 [Helobdella robusta]|uniref:tRNA-uridine aminocarboxypropyltransferase 1 n=1 Tax=Helobdella robusta TaxID=6412 RepID=T1EEG2_HELRO|nr:hypothetical protein HELRODRAFT_108178 [Helobdella robusta]ESN92805.1 hypothetical protein HELRODRAFT_108178 [Helobdella robusta]